MAIEILMPALSPTMTEGNLAKWYVKVGDHVSPGDLLAEIETDKATMEVESVDEGIVGKLLVEAGSTGVAVNEVIGLLVEEGEQLNISAASDEADAGQPEKHTQGGQKTPAYDSNRATDNNRATPLAARMAQQLGVDLASVQGSGDRGKITKADIEAAASAGPVVLDTTAVSGTGERLFASPLARRIAQQEGLDITTVPGSGPQGRVIERDVKAAIEDARAAPRDLEPASPAVSSETVPLSTMRRVIARRMVEAKTQVPHFYLSVDYRIDSLLEVRKELNEASEGVRLSVNDFIIRASALALMDVPEANVAYENENEMRQFRTGDISVAVAIEGGLITPIVKNAESKGLKQISAEMKDLAARAQSGKLMPEEYQGGSFSISNLGMFGIREFAAVINPPQACILAVGAGERRPVVEDDQLVVRSVMTCTLSVDHRVVDGVIGARYLEALKRYIEYPPVMLL